MISCTMWHYFPRLQGNYDVYSKFKFPGKLWLYLIFFFLGGGGGESILLISRTWAQEIIPKIQNHQNFQRVVEKLKGWDDRVGSDGMESAFFFSNSMERLHIWSSRWSKKFVYRSSTWYLRTLPHNLIITYPQNRIVFFLRSYLCSVNAEFLYIYT